MTLNIHLQNRRRNLGDKILKLLNRERRAILNKDAINSIYRDKGPFAYLNISAEYESFWSALWGSRKQQ